MRRLIVSLLLVLSAVNVWGGQELEQLVRDQLLSRVNSVNVEIKQHYPEHDEWYYVVGQITQAIPYDGTGYLEEVIRDRANDILTDAIVNRKADDVRGRDLNAYATLSYRNWNDLGGEDSYVYLLDAREMTLFVPDGNDRLPDELFEMPTFERVSENFPIYAPGATAVRCYQTFDVNAAWPGLGFEPEVVDEDIPLTGESGFVRLPNGVLRDGMEFGGEIAPMIDGRIEIDYADGRTETYSIDEYGLRDLLEPWPSDDEAPRTLVEEVTPTLSIHFVDGRPTVSVAGTSGTEIVLERTSDLETWSPWQSFVIGKEGTWEGSYEGESPTNFFRIK